ncbi:MAG: type II toxin-antitoxin system Phd/YefM family antitoxin [Acidobacteria bacterium]|nr:type II toxin-antitoxin system Phd/YefM family antitoxin [Acidobacteriota bacterium]
MKLISVRDLRTDSARIWEQLPGEGEMVVTSNGRPVAILASVDEDGVEEALRAFRRARAMEAVAGLQLHSAETGRDRMAPDEIETEIREARRSRRT